MLDCWMVLADHRERWGSGKQLRAGRAPALFHSMRMRILRNELIAEAGHGNNK
jgi:hypothetical protein